MSGKYEIEIGMSVVPNIYLHVANFEMETPFDVRRIEEVHPLNGCQDEGCIIAYSEEADNVHRYYVQESAELVNDAIESAKKYRDVCLKALDKYLERKTKKNAPE